MSNAAIITIAVAVVVVLGAVSLINLARHSDLRGAGALSDESLRRDRERRRESREFETEATGQGAALPPRDVEAGGAVSRGFGVALVTVDHNSELVRWVAPESDAVGVSRRQFFNRASVTLMGVGIGGFAVAAFVGFLWPTGPGGFGGVVSVGKLDAVKRSVKENGGFFYIPEARSWITEYPSEALAAAQTTYPANLLEAMESGIVVLSQKCPHLGCRVPECETSQWFECQCHGSQYNRVGEKKSGPAPRGMDRFPATISTSGDVVIDTATVVPGPAIGTNTTGQEAEGPHCVGGESH